MCSGRPCLDSQGCDRDGGAGGRCTRAGVKGSPHTGPRGPSPSPLRPVSPPLLKSHPHPPHRSVSGITSSHCAQPEHEPTPQCHHAGPQSAYGPRGTHEGPEESHPQSWEKPEAENNSSKRDGAAGELHGRRQEARGHGRADLSHSRESSPETSTFHGKQFPEKAEEEDSEPRAAEREHSTGEPTW